MPAVRLVQIREATFVEVPEINFFGREFLVRVMPGDNPVALTIEVCNALKAVMTRAKMASIKTESKIIAPN